MKNSQAWERILPAGIAENAGFLPGMADFPDTVGKIGSSSEMPDAVGRKRSQETVDTVCEIRVKPASNKGAVGGGS